MTVPSTQSRIQYTGDGVSTQFDFPFAFQKNADIRVLRISATGVTTTLVEGSDYALASVSGGGRVTLGVALPTGAKLTIFRDPELVQETDLRENDRFFAETLEQGLDRLTQISQALAVRQELALTLHEAEVGPNTEIPDVATRANKVLGFDAAGNLVVVEASTGSGGGGGTPGTPGVPGQSAVAVVLSRPSVTVPADASGVVSDFSQATGNVLVTQGAVSVTTLSAFSVIQQTNCTGTVDANGVYAVTALSADTGALGIRVTYASVTYDVFFTLTKSRAGSQGPAGSGTGALAIILSRDSAPLPAFADGSVPSYAGINALARFYDGPTEVTATTTWSIASTANCTATINTATNTPVNGQPRGYFEVTAVTADVATVTVQGVYSGNTLQRTFQVYKIKGGYEIVAALPATNLFAGRLVYLTTDAKLYRYTGSAWSKAVDGGDVLAGTVTTNALAAGAVTAAIINVTQLSAIAANLGTVTAGLIRDAASRTRFDVTAGTLIFNNGTHMLAFGPGFGTSGQFYLWGGPTQASLSTCSEANAVIYMKLDGTVGARLVVLAGSTLPSPAPFSAGPAEGAISSVGGNGGRVYATRTALISGGRAPYTIIWSIGNLKQDIEPPLAGRSINLTNPTSSVVTVSGVCTNGILYGDLVLTVTDADGRVAQGYAPITAQHGVPP
jgi:hypothetical protein